MKKSLLIGTIVVLVLAIAGCAIAFAVWDQTKSNIDLTTANVASNVKVNAAVVNDSGDTKNLIPSIAEIYGSNDAKVVKLGTFTTTLSSDNSSATAAQLADKVKATYTITKVTLGDASTDVAFNDTNAGQTYDWTRYLKVIVSSDTNTNGVMSNNTLTLSTTGFATSFNVYIEFQNFANGYTEAEMEYIRSLSGKQFRIAMLIKIESKTTVAA